MAPFVIRVKGPLTQPAPLKPYVDQRTELLGIVFHLAGNQEYDCSTYAPYRVAIDRHFDKFRKHPAITFARRLRREKFIGHTAPMQLAVCLNEPPQLLPVPRPVSSNPAEAGFARKDVELFVRKLRKFYADSDFGGFFKSHHEFYKQEEVLISELLPGFNREWFETFFGETNIDSFGAIILMSGNGSGYGVRSHNPNGKVNVVAIIDRRAHFPTLIHEFLHSVTNPMVDEHFSKFERAAQSLLPGFAQLTPAYNNARVVIYDYLVRAMEATYLRNNGHACLADYSIERARALGFFWIEQLSDYLTAYHKQRDEFKRFESFLPDVAAFLEDLAGRRSSDRSN